MNSVLFHIFTSKRTTFHWKIVFKCLFYSRPMTIFYHYLLFENCGIFWGRSGRGAVVSGLTLESKGRWFDISFTAILGHTWPQFTPSFSIWVSSNHLQSLPHDKTNKMACAPSEDSDQPGHPPSLIRLFAGCMMKAKLGPLATHWAHSEDSDQTGRMPRLIGVFAGRTTTLLVLSLGGFFFFFFKKMIIFEFKFIV